MISPTPFLSHLPQRFTGILGHKHWRSQAAFEILKMYTDVAVGIAKVTLDVR
jgi:hypothetical protein